MSEQELLISLERLERVVREGMMLSGTDLADHEQYATLLRTAVEEYLHALRHHGRQRHHPEGIPEPPLRSGDENPGL